MDNSFWLNCSLTVTQCLLHTIGKIQTLDLLILSNMTMGAFEIEDVQL